MPSPCAAFTSSPPREERAHRGAVAVHRGVRDAAGVGGACSSADSASAPPRTIAVIFGSRIVHSDARRVVTKLTKITKITKVFVDFVIFVTFVPQP